MERDQARAAERGQHADLRAVAQEVVGPVQDRGEDLDGHVPLEQHVVRPVHGGHAAASEDLVEPVAVAQERALVRGLDEPAGDSLRWSSTRTDARRVRWPPASGDRANPRWHTAAMSIPDPLSFSADWVAAWNAHDVEAVLAALPRRRGVHVPDGGAGGARQRWGVPREAGAARVLDRRSGLMPDLHFTVERVYAGVSVLVITYRNQSGGLVDEVLVFADGLVVEGHGTHLVPDGR